MLEGGAEVGGSKGREGKRKEGKGREGMGPALVSEILLSAILNWDGWVGGWMDGCTSGSNSAERRKGRHGVELVGTGWMLLLMGIPSIPRYEKEAVGKGLASCICLHGSASSLPFRLALFEVCASLLRRYLFPSPVFPLRLSSCLFSSRQSQMVARSILSHFPSHAAQFWLSAGSLIVH